jgi:hypothetical protein
VSGCQCKRGFFALRDCGEPAASTCGTCHRRVCAPHLSPASGFTQCLDCAGRAEPSSESQSQSQSQAQESTFDDDWVYGYRDRYYRGGYGPVYTGRDYHHYYDSYDTRSFDSGASDTPPDEDADETATGFGDS